MTGKIFQPQMTQMNADDFLKFIICVNLRYLRLNMGFKEILEKIGV
jgi:hypothetical protein